MHKAQRPTEPSWYSIRIPLSQIEDAYGRGNFDDAGDALADAVRGIYSNAAKTDPVKFDFDTSHSNPWFHVLIFSVSGLSEHELTRLVDDIRGLSLWPEAAAGWNREPT